MFEPVQRRVQRALADGEHVPGVYRTRLEMPQPCSGSAAMVLRMSRSSVPWSKSDGLGTDTSTIDNYTSTIDMMQTIADSQARIVWSESRSVVEAGSPGTGVSALAAACLANTRPRFSKILAQLLCHAAWSVAQSVALDAPALRIAAVATDNSVRIASIEVTAHLRRSMRRRSDSLEADQRS